MFSLKCLTKKFNKQTLNEVKPAPLSETVDHTLSSSTSFSASTVITPSTGITTITSTNNIPTSSLIPPTPGIPSFSTTTTTTPDDVPPIHHLSKHSFTDTFTDTSSTPSGNLMHDPLPHCSTLPLPSPSLSATFSSSSLSPVSSVSSSDSEEEDEEDEGRKDLPSFYRIKAHPHSPRRKKLSNSQLKIERISSAEKRKYSQFKCSTGSSSSPSSSDDEIKEAFETSTTSGPRHQWNLTPPTYSNMRAWAQMVPATAGLVPSEQQQQQPQPQAFSGWNIDHLETCTSRPLKVVPVSQHKHKFFAQMSTKFSERPFLDFNKMQHSKRLVMVRRPMVIRNNSKVHSIQRPSSLCPHVSLDISQHSFQPVLTQT